MEIGSFLKTQKIPDHVSHLLELAGASYLEDLLCINEDFLEAIEQQIRQDGFKAQVDFSSKQNRLKYFGIDMFDVSSFSFRLMDRAKLLRLPTAVQSELDGRKKAAQSGSKK